MHSKFSSHAELRPEFHPASRRQTSAKLSMCDREADGVVQNYCTWKPNRHKLVPTLLGCFAWVESHMEDSLSSNDEVFVE